MRTECVYSKIKRPKSVLGTADGPFDRFEQAVWRRITQLITGYYDREKRRYVDAAPPAKPPRTDRTLECSWRLKSIQVWVRDRFLEGVREQDRAIEDVRAAMRYLDSRRHGGGNLRKIFLVEGIHDEEKLRIRRTAWNYPGLFRVTGNNRTLKDWMEFTNEGKQLACDERRHWDEGDEARSVAVIKKLLMMTRDRRIPRKRLKWIKQYYGFPRDFESGFIARHSQHFRMVHNSRGDYVELVRWDDSLTVTEREKAVAQGRTSRADGPNAFPISYPPGYMPNAVRRAELDAFQQLEFPSPYDDAPRKLMDFSTPTGEKRVLAVYHELLSLSYEKKAMVTDLAYLARELDLPRKYPEAVLSCHPGIFYVSYCPDGCFVFLREAYCEDQLIEKNAVSCLRDRYLELMRIPPEELHDDDMHRSRFAPKKRRGVWSNRDHLQDENWEEKLRSRFVSKEAVDTLCEPIPD